MAKRKRTKGQTTIRSSKHYTENKRSSNTNPTKNWGWTHVLWKSQQYLLQ